MLLKRLDFLDWIAVVLLVLGAAFSFSGLLPRAEAVATITRILPLLVFLGAVIVLAELTAEAEVFDVIASRIAFVAGGNFAVLFLLSVAFASTTTAALNLDTTAVLLTPVMLATARRAEIAGTALAMSTVWLANTASLVLPVSNLTNLLAANRVALPPVVFAQRMLLPELVSVGVTMCFLWLFYWRRGRRGGDRYAPPVPHTPRDGLLFAIAGGGCVVFIAGVVLGLRLELTALLCAGLVALAFLFRARHALRWGMLPWRLLVFVTGLFLVVQTISLHGLDVVMRGLIGVDGGAVGVLRAAGTGALLSNALNNLPTYVAGEAVVPVANHEQLLGLLIGTNVGPIVIPWASLATLLWYERCRAAGVRIAWPLFMLTGAVTAACTLAATTWTLIATPPL